MYHITTEGAEKARGLAARMKLATMGLIHQVTLLIEAGAIEEVPKKENVLMNTITSELGATWGRVKATAQHALWVHEGTGIYGPKGKPIIIEAKNKKALTIPTGDGGVVLRKKAVVKGMKPRPFFKWAWERKVKPKVEELARRAYERVFQNAGT